MNNWSHFSRVTKLNKNLASQRDFLSSIPSFSSVHFSPPKHALGKQGGESEQCLAFWMMEISLLCQLSIRPDSASLSLRSPSTPLSAAAAAHCTLAKLALFSTVLLSALKLIWDCWLPWQLLHPSHRNGTGARRAKCVTGDVGPWESSVQSFETKTQAV